jgi:hypothetical protein
MPLLLSKEHYRPGELLVYGFATYEHWEGELEPSFMFRLGTYEKSETLSDTGKTRHLIAMKASMYCKASSYAGNRFYVPTGALSQVGCESLLGAVCGPLNCDDPYEMKAYLKQVIKKYRSRFRDDIMQLALCLVSSEDE